MRNSNFIATLTYRCESLLLACKQDVEMGYRYLRRVLIRRDGLCNNHVRSVPNVLPVWDKVETGTTQMAGTVATGELRTSEVTQIP